MNTIPQCDPGQAPVEMTSPVQSQASWSTSLTKMLVDLVLGKSGTMKSKTAKFWEEVAADLGHMTGVQCRHKYFKLNKSRTKKRGCGSGSAPVNLDECAQYLHLHERIYKMKEPAEIPDCEVATCSLSLFPDEVHNTDPPPSMTFPEKSPVPSTPQSAVETPDRKKPKRTHGTGSRTATIRNYLQQQWIAFLKKSDERRRMRLETEHKKKNGFKERKYKAPTGKNCNQE